MAKDDDRQDAQTPAERAALEFAGALKRARERAGLTQAELADKLDFTRATISLWEHGVRLPDRAIAHKLDDVLKPEGRSLTELRARASRARRAEGAADSEGLPRSGQPGWTDFGSVLREQMDYAGLSAGGLAERMGCARGTIDRYRDDRLPQVDFVERLEDALAVERGTLLAVRNRVYALSIMSPGDVTDQDVGAPPCPYKGLRSFERQDAAWFFGRKKHVEQALNKLAEPRFLGVVGSSGSGKSSFVHAGLLPALESGGSHGLNAATIATLTPGKRPLAELVRAVYAASDGAVRLRSDDLRVQPSRLERAIRKAGSPPLAIVVDQLEELFTHRLHTPRDDADRRAFVQALMGMWNAADSRCVLIVALRSDFYDDRMSEHPELSKALDQQHWLLGPMGPEDLKTAILGPADRVGVVVEPGLEDIIVGDLAGEPGALPLLSHAMLETFRLRSSGQLHLTLNAYRAIGRVQGAIERSANEALERLSADRAIVRRVFVSLTAIEEDVQPTRRRVDRADLAADVGPSDALDHVLGALSAERLITLDGDTVAIAHEALIRHWPTLKAWLEADRKGELLRRDLQARARQWKERPGDAGTLLRGGLLSDALGQVEMLEVMLGEREREFLTTSQETERRQEAEKQRALYRLRGLTAGLAMLLLAAVALAAWAVVERRNAQEEARQATSSALASSASRLVTSRPDVSLLLALEANRVSPTVEARSSALSALVAVRGRRIVGRLRRTLDGRNSTAVAFSGDGRTLASASSASPIRLWNARTGKPLVSPLADRARNVVFSPHGHLLAAAGYADAIRLWDVRTHHRVGAPLTGYGRDVNDLAFAPSGRLLASAGDDGRVHLWDVRTQKQVGRAFVGHRGEVMSVAFSADGRTLASGGIDNTVRLWNVSTREQRGRSLSGHSEYVSSVAFSRDGRRLASSSWDAGIRMWDVQRHRQIGTPMGASQVNSVAFSRDGRTIVSAGADNVLRLWDARTRKAIGTIAGHSELVWQVAFSPDGRTLASAAGDGVRLWDVRAPEPVVAPLGPDQLSVNSVAFSPRGNIVASGGDDAAVRLTDVRTRRQVGAPMHGHTGVVWNVAFSPDGHKLASASADSSIRLWDPRTGKRLAEPLLGHGTSDVFGVAFSPNGRALASAGGDKTVRLWDVRSHAQIGRPLRGHSEPVLAVAYSPDGRTLASAGEDRTIRLWDVGTQKLLGQLAGHEGRVSGLVFTPDGRTLASSSWDNTVRLWDVHANRQRGQPLTGHTHQVNGVAFTPDGRTLATASFDTTIRIWDVASHRQLGSALLGPVDSVQQVTFSPDGRSLASAGGDTGLRLWDKILWRDVADLKRQVCSVIGSPLRRSEWEQYGPGVSHRQYRQSCSPGGG